MSREVWLYPNRRALRLAALLPLLLLLAGAPMVLAGAQPIIRGVGGGLIVGGAALLGAILHALRQPRLAYQDGHLLVYLRHSGPVRVPIDVVEVFFLGQSPTRLLPRRETRTANVVVRLAERDHPWKDVRVNARLGHWQDGYITIRGAWTEPINRDLMQSLNNKLRTQLRRRSEAQKGSHDTAVGERS